MRFFVQITAVVSCALLMYSCATVRSAFHRKERPYQPPRIGAEHRFEDGLRRQKNPQNLFSRKERREMEKMGMLTSEKDRAAPNERITPMQADSMLTGKTRDTTRTAIDSTQTIPADTTVPRPADTAKGQF
ncbi:hypothetical protein [Chitinophaga sp. XS-30]|uniref:hypothetical protein n=1 Tax=Chitinophaga sp. XS-30 TaxID=2604421 RepID=UPI0011DD7688|nr:hypothetical protein [Chitinophaga sp. XS-30]QEH43556.1 hypothetical protein FW415_22960 [Chitinophaga sp. XS-30]